MGRVSGPLESGRGGKEEKRKRKKNGWGSEHSLSERVAALSLALVTWRKKRKGGGDPLQVCGTFYYSFP